MPIDPNIIAGLHTTAPPVNPLGDLQTIMQIRQAQAEAPYRIQQLQQNAQEGALKTQETQRAIADRDNIRKSYAASITTDPNTQLPTTDPDKLVQSMVQNNVADQIPIALESLNKVKKASADLQEQQQKIKATQAEYAAGLGTFIKANAYNPDVYRQQLQTAVANKDTSQGNAAQILQQLDALDKQDPTGAASRQFTQQHADAMISMGGPAFTTAQARKEQAETGADTAATNKPRIQAETANLQGQVADRAYQQAVGQLATNPPKDADAYQAFIDQQPHSVATRILSAVPAAQYDPAKSPAVFNQSAMTAEQRAQANKPLAQRNPTEAELALTAAKGLAPGATPQEVSEGQAATAARKLMTQDKIAARPVIQNVLPTSTPGAPQTTGDDFLKTISPSMASQVKAVAMGDDNMPSAGSRSQAAIQLRDMVYRYDPSFTTQRAQIRKALTSGAEGRNIGNLNTAAVHLHALGEISKAMDNGSFQPGNALYNAVATQLGSTPPTNYEGLRQAVAGEMDAALHGTSTIPGRADIAATIPAKAAPGQISGAVDTNLHTIAQKLNTYRERYEQQIPNDKVWSPILPSAAAVFSKHGVDTGPVTNNASAVAAPKSKADYDALPKGAHYTKNGQEFVKQ